MKNNKFKNSFKKLFALCLSILSVFSIFSSLAVTANAATTYYLKTGTYLFESKAKSKVMMNLYANNSANCTKVCTWVKDGSNEQIFRLAYEGNGAYRIYFYSHPNKCVDVLRYNNPLKAGQLVECYTDNDDTAQLVVPYRVDKNTVIFRMKANTNLAISIKNTKNGTQMVLAKFNKSDKNQQFIVRNTSFSKVDAFTTQEPSTNTVKANTGLKGIPTSKYKVNANYTIGNKTYKYCVTTQKYNGVAKNTEFFLQGNTVVTATNILKQLNTIRLVNATRITYKNALDSMYVATNKIYSTAHAWTRNQSISKWLGRSGCLALASCAGSPVVLFDSTVNLCSTAASDTDEILSATVVTVLKALANNSVYYCTQASNLLSRPITDYNAAVKAIKSTAEAYGYYNSAMFLGRPIVEDAAKVKNVWTKTFATVGIAMLETAGISAPKALEFYDNAKNLAELLSDIQCTYKYTTNRNKVLKTFGI